jgi:hypothetical protein
MLMTSPRSCFEFLWVLESRQRYLDSALLGIIGSGIC